MIDLSSNPSFFLLPPLLRDTKTVQFDLYHVHLPMAFSFKTAKTAIEERETIIVRATAQDGSVGYGECVSFATPFYTEETLNRSWSFMEQALIPALFRPQEGRHPLADFHALEKEASSMPMAVAAVENALLDVSGRQGGHNTVTAVCGQTLQATIPLGVALGDLSVDELLSQIERHVAAGCQRIKIKIKPSDGLERLRAVRQAFPTLTLAADANGSFTIEDWKALQSYDALHLVCLEEPFPKEEREAYAALRRSPDWTIQTPICLDESILSMDDLRWAMQHRSIDVLNVKIGRLGGLYNAKTAIDFCRKYHIQYWIGSMVESSISKMLHVQLAALGDACMAGDLSDSKRYFSSDFTTPDLAFDHGYMKVPRGPGLGVTVEEKRIQDASLRHICISR